MHRMNETDARHEGRGERFMDEDRMVNEGLSGGRTIPGNGRIGSTTTDTMDQPESVMKGGTPMNAERAREIIQSDQTIDVHWKGEPVWINEVRGNQAEVQPAGKDEPMSVPVEELREESTRNP